MWRINLVYFIIFLAAFALFTVLPLVNEYIVKVCDFRSIVCYGNFEPLKGDTVATAPRW